MRGGLETWVRGYGWICGEGGGEVWWKCEVECGTLGGWWGRGRRWVDQGDGKMGEHVCIAD